MQEWLTSSLSFQPRLSVAALIDILVVAFLIYQFILIVKGRRAGHVLIGLAILMALYVVAVQFRLELLRSILANLAPYTAFAVIVMFQSEIRRVLARLGQRRWISFRSRLQTREFTDELLLAMARLSEQRTGALIVLERDIGLRTFVESGVALEACVSRDLLLAVFQTNGALHDGAVIIQGERIAAASCFLPLSTSAAATSDMGTRHRAALGVTEEADCLALVVSEETGWLSVAAFNKIERNLTIQQVEDRIERHFSRNPDSPGPKRHRSPDLPLPSLKNIRNR